MQSSIGILSGFGSNCLKKGGPSNGHLGTIFDLTEKSSYSAMIEKGDRRFAWGLGSPLGMHANPVDKLMYVVDTTRGCLYQLPKEGGNMRFAPAMATGFIEPYCVRWHRDGKYAFVCDKRAGAVFRIVVDEWENLPKSLLLSASHKAVGQPLVRIS
jgi:sugar lactone lactonase YvrE